MRTAILRRLGRARRSGVRWLSVGPGTGYGQAAEEYISGMIAAGVPVTWSPLGAPSDIWLPDGSASDSPPGPPQGPVRDLARYRLGGAPHVGLAHRAIEHDTVVVHAPPLWHDRLGEEARGKALVAYTTWETDRLPAEWVAVLDRYDRVLVPSRFNQQVFSAAGIQTPIEVVPHLVASTLGNGPRPRRAPRRRRLVPEDVFVFHTVGTWTSRKAMDDLVAAYLLAFEQRDPVALVIHTKPDDRIAGRRLGVRPGVDRPREAMTWVSLARLLAGHPRPPRIVLNTSHLDRTDVARLHAESDCFLTLSRGEGWGLGPFEAAAAGTPSILTGWGGSLEFLPANYPYLVDFDLIPTSDDPPDEIWQPRPGERWARARVAHAAELMRHVQAHPGEAREWGRRLQDHVLARFSASIVIEQLLAELDAVG